MTVAGQTTVTYTYDNANRPIQMAQGSSTVIQTYDNANRLSSRTLPNGLVVTYTYDGASRISGINYVSNGAQLGNMIYGYDTNGRRISIGGSLAQTNLPLGLASTSYNAGNQLVQRGAVTLTYDLNGNMTSDGVSSLIWDARNQLSSLNGSSFAYDERGRRTQNAVGTKFVYDGSTAVQELSGSTVTANLLTGAGADNVYMRTDSTGSRMFLSDVLGSTLGLTDASGALQTRYSYEPFGQTTTTGAVSANSSQFTGRENDGTGLYYYRARYYSPVLQRFISEDPAGLSQGLNMYSYAGNSPTNGNDPSGLWSAQAHASMLRHAFQGCNVPDSEIRAMIAASLAWDVATGANPDYNNAHSMRNHNQSAADAISRRDRFIERQLSLAPSEWGQGKSSLGLTLLGEAEHTLMDSTSPSHMRNGEPLEYCETGCNGSDGHGAFNDTPGNHERWQDITPEIYRQEDAMLRRAYERMTQRALSCRYQ